MSEIPFLKYFICCSDEDTPSEAPSTLADPKEVNKMSSPASDVIVDQPTVTASPPVEGDATPSIEISSAAEPDSITNEPNPVTNNLTDEIDTDGEDGDISPMATVVPSNTPVTGDSGQGSPNMQSSTDSLSDDATLKSEKLCSKTLEELSETPLPQEEVTSNGGADPSDSADTVSKLEAALSQGDDAPDNKVKATKAGRKEEKKEEKKKSKKKEDKSIDYILRALNSLQSPEEKLAALCKKYADLHEEHRVLQTSFKTQQRTIAVVMREKDQLQSEHTKAMMAKSKLESLCRELQKHNKIIKDESIKRAKEDDEKRKEISSQFNHTIGEIQTQMADNSERNAKLRQENENLAAQLRSFIKQCEVRDLQVTKLQEQHELERQLANAKVNQAQAIVKEHEEKGIKERELLLLKLAESGKKNQILETQVAMFKERYDDFERLHAKSSETFQKYKTEMDKMTKRIKKLEKDGLQWKAKWEGTNKALIEQIEARSKSEKDCLMYIQKSKKLESLCRALQAELHGKKVVETDTKTESQDNGTMSATPSSSPEPANPKPIESPCNTELSEAPSSSPCKPETSETTTSSTDPSPTSSPPPLEPASSDQCQPETASDAISTTAENSPPAIASTNSCETAPECAGSGEPASCKQVTDTKTDGSLENDQADSVA
ncbi:alpha-taxilin-like isoform X1 [Biomphalaria glabrata]|uniref:Alpha-taxilin-like isoform X1 n=2 Tax=Biomphalaria glabrata TaxID=6526 RepID=A0A9W3APD1_BIOGL|nr:alpha-taxilin-like isoform X1 [Biomphalaria glabrata]